jgi:serine/threonine protein phosphatase PrpC
LELIGYEPPPADLDDGQMFATQAAINDAILRRTQADGSHTPDSRTTLVIALVTAQRIQWATLGDSGLYVADRRGIRRLDTPSGFFAGRLMGTDDIEQRSSRGATTLEGPTTVVAVTDGLMEFTADPEAAIHAALEAGAGGSAEDLARAVALEAFKAGAGDNIGVAVTSV